MEILLGIAIGCALMLALNWYAPWFYENQVDELRQALEKERAAHRALWLWCNRECSNGYKPSRSFEAAPFLKKNP